MKSPRPYFGNMMNDLTPFCLLTLRRLYEGKYFAIKTDPGINNLNNLVSTWLTENGFSSNDPINDLEKLLTQKIRQDAKSYVVDAIKSME